MPSTPTTSAHSRDSCYQNRCARDGWCEEACHHARDESSCVHVLLDPGPKLLPAPRKPLAHRGLGQTELIGDRTYGLVLLVVQRQHPPVGLVQIGKRRPHCGLLPLVVQLLAGLGRGVCHRSKLRCRDFLALARAPKLVDSAASSDLTEPRG